MKKLLIGSLVGGILIFIWQTLSWTVLDLHRPMQEYTPKQDTVLHFLSTQFSEDGFYFMPTTPKGTPSSEQQQLMEKTMGKPWAQVFYHQALEVNMGANIIRGLIVTLLMTGLLCWILMKINQPGFMTIFISCIFTGLIVFINEPYTQHIWYRSPDINAHLIDALASWGLCGLWLGWWLGRKK
jgi:hypothetical protein